MSIKRYFFLDEAGDGMVVFNTARERDEAVAMEIEDCSDFWMDTLECIVSGYLTHTCEKVNIVHRPPFLPLNKRAEVNGVWWDANMRYCCDYKMTAIEEEMSKEPLTPQFMATCNVCGNKRCPHCTDSSKKCTGSNETGQ